MNGTQLLSRSFFPAGLGFGLGLAVGGLGLGLAFFEEDLDLDLRIVDLDLDFTVAGLVTSLLDGEYLGRFYKKANGQQEKSSRLPLQCVTKPCPAGCRHFTAINTVEIGDCPRASDDAVMMQ